MPSRLPRGWYLTPRHRGREQANQTSAGGQFIPKPKSKDNKIKILLLSANPAGTGILKLDEETREITAKVRASAQRDVQVVVLNACYSRPQAEAIAAIVPCVIGIKGTIGDRAARVFAASFYSALGFGHSVQVAFKQGLARLKIEGFKVEGSPQSDVPALITRSDVKASDIVPVTP